MNIHEEGIAKFLLKHRRHRYFTVIGNPDKRHEIINKLAHNSILDEKFAHPIPKHLHDAELTYQYLKTMGAPDLCYAISEKENIDGKEVELLEALKEIRHSGFGTILSLKPGIFAYYEGEDDRFVLLMP